MTLSTIKHAKITAIACAVPENYINIDDEIQYYGNDPKKLARNKNILGLGKRHVVEEGVGGIDLAECAVRNLVEKCGIDISDIDALVFASSGHDYPYPASSCILHGRLNLPEKVSCFDFSGLACSGYVYHLWTISSMIEAGVIKKCLYIAADIGSTHTNPKNRNVCILFGDGAVATLIERTEKEKPAHYYTGTNGKDWDKIVAPFGGFKNPIRGDIVSLEVTDDNGNVWHLWEDILKGFDVFKYTALVGPKGIKEILDFARKSVEDVDFFAIHQANKQIVDTIARHSKIPEEKYSSETFTKYGNDGVASVATNICDALSDKKVKNIVLATFGIGLSFSFAMIDMSETVNGGVNFYKTPKDMPSRKEQIDHWIKYFKGEIDRV